jgi:hypothetical protein
MMRMPIYTLLAALAMALPAQSANRGQPPIIVRKAPDIAPAAPDPAQVERYDRARRNLEALARGTINVGDLGPQDLQDVLDFNRIIRGGGPDNRSYTQQCVDDEVRRLNGRPSRLAWRVIALKCREIGN